MSIRLKTTGLFNGFSLVVFRPPFITGVEMARGMCEEE
jgi:hypothetical protein